MKNLEIRIGGLHHLYLNETTNVISGEIVKQVGKYYLVYVKEANYSYHINESGKIIVYSAPHEKVALNQEIKEGILFISIDLLADSVFLFNGKVLESDLYFYVRDMFCDNPFLLEKESNTSVPYKKGIDSSIDAQLDAIADAQDE